MASLAAAVVADIVMMVVGVVVEEVGGVELVG